MKKIVKNGSAFVIFLDLEGIGSSVGTKPKISSTLSKSPGNIIFFDDYMKKKGFGRVRTTDILLRKRRFWRDISILKILRSNSGPFRRYNYTSLSYNIFSGPAVSTVSTINVRYPSKKAVSKFTILYDTE